MPNSYEIELVAEQDDCGLAVFKDVSVYSDDLRSDKANFLVVSKNDKNGTPTYLTVLNTAPLSQVQWEVPTTLMGWYRANLIRLTLYSSSPVNTVHELTSGSVITQYATVLYHTPTQQVVKAKTTGTINVQPGQGGWQTYWEVVSNLSTLVNYGSIQVHVHHDLIDCLFRDKLADMVDEVNNKPNSNNPDVRVKLYEKSLQLQVDINNLNAMLTNGEHTEMEETVTVMTEKYL